MFHPAAMLSRSIKQHFSQLHISNITVKCVLIFFMQSFTVRAQNTTSCSPCDTWIYLKNLKLSTQIWRGLGTCSPYKACRCICKSIFNNVKACFIGKSHSFSNLCKVSLLRVDFALGIFIHSIKNLNFVFNTIYCCKKVQTWSVKKVS